MKIDIHCKGMSLTDAIREHVEEKLGKLDRILPGEIDTLVILSFDPGPRGGLYEAEVSLRAWNTDIVAKDESEDLYKAISVIAESAFGQARKAKEKRATRRKGGDTVRNYVPPAEPMTPEEEDEEEFDAESM